MKDDRENQDKTPGINSLISKSNGIASSYIRRTRNGYCYLYWCEGIIPENQQLVLPPLGCF